MIRLTYHIPTEQYGFVEVETDDMAQMSYEEAKALYVPPVALEGLPDKEFNACLDRYLTDGTGETDVYLRMSKEQQHIIQCLKRAFKRIEAKETT